MLGVRVTKTAASHRVRRNVECVVEMMVRLLAYMYMYVNKMLDLDGRRGMVGQVPRSRQSTC